MLLASGAEDRQALRKQAGELEGMVARAVKDLGVDTTLGAGTVRHTQTGRISKAVEACKRIARLPNGWGTRIIMARSLAEAQHAWGGDVTGYTGQALARLRHWMAHAVTGGATARRAPEVVLAAVAPQGMLDPEFSFLSRVILGWGARVSHDPGLATLVMPACLSSTHFRA